MRSIFRLALILALLFAFWLRLQELTRQDIWWDEARNIDVALRPFLQVAIAPELDIHPPIYFWLLHGWNQLFGLVAGVAPAQLALVSRLLSVFAGVAGAALLFPLGRRAGGNLAGLLALVVGACSPFWLAESQEARMYTVGFALLTAAAVAFLSAWRAPTAGAATTEATSATSISPADVHLPIGRDSGGQVTFRRGWLTAFVILSAATLLTHYNAVFILVAWYIWWGGWALLQPNRWRQLGTVFVCGLAMTVLVLPVAPIALRQIPGYANPNITIPTVGEYLSQNWQAYLGGYAFDPALLANQATLWLWLVLAVSTVGVILTLASARPSPITCHVSHLSPITHHPSPVTTLTFLLTWLLGGLALYYLAVLDRNAFNVRYSSFVTPALYTLIGVGLAAYARWWKPLPVVALALLLVGLWPALQADLYDTRHDREHIGEVTAWLRANAQPGDVIFVDQKYPFGFYYQPYTIDPTAALPANAAPPARYLFVDINTVDQQLDAWAKDAKRVFWVQWFESDTDPRRAVHFLLNKSGRHAGEEWFQGYSIDWWELNPPTDFVLAPNLQPAAVRIWARRADGGCLAAPNATATRRSAAGGHPLATNHHWRQRPAAQSPRRALRCRRQPPGPGR